MSEKLRFSLKDFGLYKPLNQKGKKVTVLPGVIDPIYQGALGCFLQCMYAQIWIYCIYIIYTYIYTYIIYNVYIGIYNINVYVCMHKIHNNI
jgi:hypothetical protein